MPDFSSNETRKLGLLVYLLISLFGKEFKCLKIFITNIPINQYTDLLTYALRKTRTQKI